MTAGYDAVVVGSGPNGLAAAIRLAEAGRGVLVVEAAATPGGGTRSRELTRPGFIHDVCSAIHPLGAGSPFFARLPLRDFGLEWVHPHAPVAHPLDDGPAVVLERSVDATAVALAEDQAAWRQLFRPLVHHWEALRDHVLGPPLRLPRRPLVAARFGLRGVRSVTALADRFLTGPRARGLLAGLAAHAVAPFGAPFTGAFGLLFGASAHAVGWPLARGGSQSIADALVAHLQDLGGEVETGVLVTDVAELPPARATLLDVSPPQALAMAGDLIPSRVRRGLESFRPGAGVFKLDYALDGPVPWKAPGPERAATVHLGGTFEEIACAERDVAEGRHPDRPYVLVAQHTLFDATRAPEGKHTLWAYCHVPNGSTEDMTGAIEGQLERFAPGFRDLVLERHTMGPAALADYNPNNRGGDISGGAHDGLQAIARPRLAFDPYRIGETLWLCSSSTPPGAGVHGMCGYHAAESVLRSWG